MIRRLGMIAVLMLGSVPAFASTHLVCNDGRVVRGHGKACKNHGGVAYALPKKSARPVAQCGDGTVTRNGYNACLYHGGVVRWL